MRTPVLPALALFLALLLPAGGPARAGEIGAEAGLSLAGAAVVLENPFVQTWEALSRARFQLKLFLGSSATLEAHYQATATYGKDAGTLGATPPTRLRITDLEPELASGDDNLILQNLDRLWLNLNLGGLGIGLGRQVIGHGPGRFFNPTDIFAPLPVLTTYTEYKSGVDAVRLTKILDGGGEIELIGVGHRDGLEKGMALVRGSHQFSGWGLSAYGGFSRERPTLALAASGDLGSAGWYAEGLGRLGKDPFVRAMAGIDYRFPFGLEVFAEAYHNSSGAGGVLEYAAFMAGGDWTEGEVFLLGRWYSALNLGYDLTPLIRAEATWVQNWGDGSAMVVGGLSWDLSDRVTLRTGLLLGLGRETELGSGGLRQGTEFGDYGKSWYLEAKLSL